MLKVPETNEKELQADIGHVEVVCDKSYDLWPKFAFDQS